MMVESALSPPYDGSEFEELFPELGKVEPEVESDDMIDIESLVEEKLDVAQITSSDEGRIQNMCDEFSNLQRSVDEDLQSYNSGSPLSAASLDLEEEAELPEADVGEDQDLLRYLIGETSNDKDNSKLRRSRKRRLLHDSDDLPHTSNSASSGCVNSAKRKSSVSHNGAVPARRQKVKPPKTTITLVCEDGVKRTLQGPNRNAVMAKLNRERKKQHMSDLEVKVGLLDTENGALKKQNRCLRKKLAVIEQELLYVKGVLANQSALAGLLKNIQATGLEFHSSMNMRVPAHLQSSHVSKTKGAQSNARKNRRMDDHDYCLDLDQTESVRCHRGDTDKLDDIPNCVEKVIVPAASDAAGVCLHVSDGAVSLEFCAKCSTKAKAAQVAAKTDWNH